MNSYWLSENQKSKFPKIEKNYNTEVCVIGGGICGLSIGYELAKNNIKTIILERDHIGEKTSGNTTAKITLQHNLIYDYLINSFGIEFATKYFKANKEAIENIKNIIDLENIECDFEWQDNYVYTVKKEELQKIHNEIKAINSLEENYAEFVIDSELPFKIEGAIKIKKQAQFHPIKYMNGLVKAIENYGGKVFENSLVTDVEKDVDGYNIKVNGNIVKAKKVVIASHYPFINFPGMYFLKMYQSTSYAIAADIGENVFDGMYINSSEPIYSFRNAKFGDKKLLIIAGGDHKTGFAPNDKNGYKVLEEKLKELYPESKTLYRWNTRDCITLDKVPYVGEFSKLMPNVYVITGFNKWGMTSSNVAANIIKDKILGNKNKYEEIFNSSRKDFIKNREELNNMISQVAKSFTINRLKIPKEDIDAIKNNNGGIIKIEGKQVGIYKDPNGKIYGVSPNCTHLGCLLTWNNIDKTWDCPCHGSRFDFKGKNIYDPAFKNLEIINIE